MTTPLSKFTFLIEFRGGGSRTVTWSGASAEDAKDLVWPSLSDADKERVHAITLVASTLSNPAAPAP